MNNFRFLQWNGNVVREEGGICNAPFKQRKDSICYFSAAVQLMFHSFSTGMKKQLLLYDVMTTSGDIDVIGKVLDVSEMLYQGKNISYDAKTSMRLATQATVDKKWY
jgi:hypothetical protein